MDFRKYIGYRKGQDPGANEAHRFLQNQILDIKYRIANLARASLHTEYNIKQLEALLNSFLDVNTQQLKNSQLNQRIKELIENKYNIKLSENWNLGDPNYRMAYKSAIASMKQAYQSLYASKNRQNETNKNFNIRYDFVKKAYNKIKYTKNKSDAVNEFCDECKNCFVILDQIYAGAKVAANKNALTRVITNEILDDINGEIKKGKKKLEKNDAQGALQILDKLYSILNTNPPEGTIGDALEYFLSYLTISQGNMAYNMIKKFNEDLIKKTGVHTGGTQINRGSGETLSVLENISATDMEILDQFKFGIDEKGLKLELDKDLFIDLPSSINPFTEKQGKMDVKFDYDFGDGINRNFRISAKNWNGLSGQDLGETSIVDAIYRSANKESLDMYLFTMQHPTESIRPAGTKAIQLGHVFAQASIIADIAIGLSQKQGYANTLVILDRASGKFIVKDLLTDFETLLLPMVFEGYIPKSTDSFYVQGYEQEKIQSIMRNLRATIREKHKHNSYETKWYLQLGYAALKSMLVQVKLSQSLS